MNTGTIIKSLRKKMGLTQTELAERLGYSDRSTLARIEAGAVDITQKRVMEFANIFDVSPLVILGIEDVSGQSRKIPVFGRVAAGIPITAIENIIDYEEIPESWVGDYGALLVVGDSMSPRIMDNDVVIVKKQSTADSGDIVVAIVNGEDATVKKLIKRKDGIVLQPLNPDYEPMFFTQQEIDRTPVTIWGKVVEIRAKV